MFKLPLRFSLQKILLLAILCIPFPAAAELDLDAWDALLNKAVINGHVDYAQWQNNPTFNILAARGILDGSSPSNLLSRYVYFKRDTYMVGENRTTLHALEHNLIRPLQEPRIHFAIVCASKSCPILQSKAYTLQDLDQQLTMAAKGFINNPQRNQFNAITRRAELSSLFKWFEEDFVAAAGSLQAYLAPMVDNAEVAGLLKQGAFEISYRKYDWRLNGAR